MVWYTIGYSFFIAVILAMLFASLLKQKGPWDNFWIFLLVVFFGVWGVSLWFNPIGPLWYGVAWVDLLFVGLFLALFLSAAGEANNKSKKYRKEVDLVEEAKKDQAALTMFGIFFWLFLGALFTLVVVGAIRLATM